MDIKAEIESLRAWVEDDEAVAGDEQRRQWGTMLRGLLACPSLVGSDRRRQELINIFAPIVYQNAQTGDADEIARRIVGAADAVLAEESKPKPEGGP